MAIEIGPIAKPRIYLEGTRIFGVLDTLLDYEAQWQGRVDHAKNEPVTTLNVIGGVTQYNDKDILTFADNVRIVIVQQLPDSVRPDYHTASATLPLDDNIKEGSVDSLVFKSEEYSRYNQMGKYAETYFTMNGKPPVRTKSYLYKYPTVNIGEDMENIDFTGLGFLLGSCQTGSDLITIKAQTYFEGKESRVAIARFKIARQQSSIEIANGVPIEGV